MKIPYLVGALAVALSSPAFAQKASVEYAHQVASSNSKMFKNFPPKQK